MQFGLPTVDPTHAAGTLADPAAYRGLYAFHKYWGKKPAEPMRYLIEQLCPAGGVVVDPFLGSGISALEAVQLRRRFVGIDINPAAVRLSQMLVSPPAAPSITEALARLSSMVRPILLDSYSTVLKRPATHFLWRNNVMEKVWLTQEDSRCRLELQPAAHDLSLAHSFYDYKVRFLRCPRFFSNSRINASPLLTLKSLFTGRALRNIELLLEAIGELPKGSQEPLRLCLTAAVGQMSKMVFAITGRGKTSGPGSERTEVGSWVIGYWRPAQHFEVNVWNCFERRVRKLIKAVSESESANCVAQPGTLKDVCAGDADYSILGGNCLEVLTQLPDKSIDLVITDPPHGDRIPYLELSELWNVILGEEPPFEAEIVVSNAKERCKTKAHYNAAMARFLGIARRKLRDNGYLVLFFNSRTESSWQFVNTFSDSANTAGMFFSGCFPLVYSSTSVVQDNRKGALRTDYGLVFSRSASAGSSLTDMPGWTVESPTPRR